MKKKLRATFNVSPNRPKFYHLLQLCVILEALNNNPSNISSSHKWCLTGESSRLYGNSWNLLHLNH